MALTNPTFAKKVDELTNALKQTASEEEGQNLVSNYLKSFENFTQVPDFDSGLEWLNCTNHLSFNSQLQGKLCVLDFFTYCCINCMHVLPDLEALEQECSVKDGLVIIGVHSAKFENEKSSANILSAVLRYDITHPVVNDADAKLWHELGVACWPTLVIVGPQGELLLSLVGEGHRKELLHFVKAALRHYKSEGKIKGHGVGISLAKEVAPKSKLLYPGKVYTDQTGKKLVISDTGHNRVIITSIEGVILDVVGGGTEFMPGFVDGSFQDARFHAPQGVATLNDRIFIADTKNHAIREINMDTKKVTTIAGDGTQGSDREGGKIGISQSISSPWDIVLGPAPGSKTKDVTNVLYIAMAGTHQIWTLYLEDGCWLKGGSQKAGTCLRFAGSGNEENQNNSYPHKASFAQPSGLALVLSDKMRCLFVADSESSSIRSVDIATGATKAIVGADRDPLNLFAFGDFDGKGFDAKLQHPLGVTWNMQDNLLYVADSYNHKVKTVNPLSKTCSTFLGHGQPDPDLLDEPGGLYCTHDGQWLYVADTNNHAIRVIDIHTKKSKEIHIIDQKQHSGTEHTDSGPALAPSVKRLTSAKTHVTWQEPTCVLKSSDLQLQLRVALPPGCHLTEGATSRWQTYCVNKKGERFIPSEFFCPASGEIYDNNFHSISKMRCSEELAPAASIQVEGIVYFCEESGTCRMAGFLYETPFSFDESASSSVTIDITHSCKL